jgi:two-component system chemotaxis response regulator CheB
MKRGPRRFRCHTGHAYSPGSLLEDHREHTERAVAVLLRLLDDEVNLLAHVRENLGENSEKRVDLDNAEAEARRRAELVRTLLPSDPPVGLSD